jgi:toxin HigB-1
MIMSFRDQGLANFYATESKAGFQAKHAERIRLILVRLQASREPKDMILPGLKLHALSGNYEGFWAVIVSGNWRILFRFEGQDVADVDYLDHH